MKTKAAGGVNQLELAADLGVSDRRIRQLVDEFILPAAHHDSGLFDLPLCRERYRLYRTGSDRDWEAFYDDAERLAGKTKVLFGRALSDAGTLDDLRAASRAIQDDACRMKFLTACRSKSDAEREMFHGIWDREETAALASLLARTKVLLESGNPKPRNGSSTKRRTAAA